MLEGPTKVTKILEDRKGTGLKIKKMSDEECLSKFIEMLEKRITINTGFVKDPDTEILTHQVLKISCGEYVTISEPEPLDVPLKLATAQEQGVTIN